MTPFTLLHVALSLVGILAGAVVMLGMLQARRLPGWTALFLSTTLATTLTGFLFPFNGFTPAIGTGLVSSVVLVVLLFALYRSKLQGGARTVFALTATISLYLNLFVLVVQSFLKIPALHALAPLGTEPPFAAAQGVVLLASIALGYFCVKAARHRTSAFAF